MIIPGFSNYSYINGKFYNNKSGKELAVTTSKSSRRVKLKSDDGVWKSIALSTVLAILFQPEIPAGFVEIPYFPKYYISKAGEVWSAPNHQHPLGKYLKVYYPEGKYPTVKIAGRNVELHQLLARAFIMPDYVERGLCVLHLDDDKKNFNLSNLRVGTYSENNSAAYATGANPGKL